VVFLVVVAEDATQTNTGGTKSTLEEKVKTTELGIAAIALVISSAVMADVPTSYVSRDHLDNIGGGSGVVIGPHEVLTDNHVVDGCTAINVFSRDAYVQAHDETNDLAVVHTRDLWATWALFSNETVRAGDTAVAMGYPLAGVLADTANVSVGHVSALAGLFNDSRFLQVTTPIQPGNSGGGLFDANGGIIGVVQSKLDLAKFVKYFGDLPQNVNFAIKTETARAFLNSNGIKYQVSPNLGKKLSPSDIGEMTRPFTVRIDCYGKQQIAKPDQQQQPRMATAPQQPPAPPPSESDAPKHPIRIVNASTGYLNLRSGPGTSFQQIASIPEGSTVLVGRCVKPEGLLPFCEVEWQGKSGWASSCCMAELFSYRVTQNLMLRSAPDKHSWNVLSDYAPKDYIPQGTIFTWTNRPDAGICTVGNGGEIWCGLSYDHDRVTSQGWVSAHFLRDNYGVLLACRYATPDPECAR
jgi:S1-C subfamily serine protease